MCGGGGIPIVSDVVDAVKDSWTDIRDTVESAAVVAGNYVLPGSSMITSHLTSEGSQDQLNSTVGRIATAASGITGGFEGNTSNYGKIGDAIGITGGGEVTGVTPDVTGSTPDVTATPTDGSGLGLKAPTSPAIDSMGGAQGLTAPTGAAPGVESMGGAQGITGASGSVLGDPSSFINDPSVLAAAPRGIVGEGGFVPANQGTILGDPNSFINAPDVLNAAPEGVVSEAGFTPAGTQTLGDPASFINGGVAGTNLFPWGEALTGAVIGAVGPKLLDAITTLLTPKAPTNPATTPVTKATENLDGTGVAMTAGKPGLGSATGGTSGSIQGVANTLLTTKDSGTLG